MIPELGHYTLILASSLSLVFALLFFKNSESEGFARQSLRRALTLFTLIGLSFLSLMWSALSDDFSVAYLANHSNSNLPWYYKATMLWGAHEGSVLLWLLILSAWTLWQSFQRQCTKEYPQALAILFALQAFFGCFILFTSNPFLRILPIPPLEGADLNPLLQDPAFVIHPPTLYLGYVGMSIPFALSLASLIQKQWSQTLTDVLRKSTLLAFGFLTLGIMLGSWWAYYELGWGGFWFWDPVENASLMPWLAACGLLHTVMVLDKKQELRSTVIFLALLTFSLSLFGTFLVRSGLVSSVHAFASDPSRGLVLLGLIATIICVSFTLYAARAQTQNIHFALVSRETMLLTQALLMLVTLGTVLIGTLYPLLAESLFEEKLSVGPPFFNTILVPIWLLILF
jgi:cytochrome c-type biogenesis protein CcmF